MSKIWIFLSNNKNVFLNLRCQKYAKNLKYIYSPWIFVTYFELILEILKFGSDLLWPINNGLEFRGRIILDFSKKSHFFKKTKCSSKFVFYWKNQNFRIFKICILFISFLAQFLTILVSFCGLDFRTWNFDFDSIFWGNFDFWSNFFLQKSFIFGPIFFA